MNKRIKVDAMLRSLHLKSYDVYTEALNEIGYKLKAEYVSGKKPLMKRIAMYKIVSLGLANIPTDVTKAFLKDSIRTLKGLSGNDQL